ncbi:EpsG family protein [Enterobacter sp. R1(2018)]|uniref:EpsG family protein n=1 Tax=Enterobacter sp. R1(2018) TaxID=2447891 RepID=UPI000EB168B8|nr:EpsG family protein [Enterobacter sp. R1(2018)]RKQ38343.1 EpsG family protein [Enterobacter sp. R1(2018)]
MIDFLDKFFDSLYGLTVLFAFLIALLCKGLKENSLSAIGTVLIIFLLAVLFGFRTIDTGTDTFAYSTWFSSLEGSHIFRDFEPLFTIIGQAVNLFTTDTSVFFTFITGLTLYYISKAGMVFSSILVVPLSIVMSVSFVSGIDLLSNGIRNGLALAIASYALLKYLDNGKGFKYLVYITMASMIHSSCIVFFIIFVIKPLLNERYLKIIFYIYIAIFFAESLKVFDFLFTSISNAGIGSHVISRILAFKYQESDMFSGFIKYYFFAITIIPYLLFKFKYYVNKRLAIVHYVLLMPYAMIFSSPSSYRFSYMSFYLMVFILAQAVLYNNSRPKRLVVYVMIIAMMIITYTTKTSMSYRNLLFI